MIVNLNGMELSSVPTSSHKQLIHVRINKHVKYITSKPQKQQPNPKEIFEITKDKHHIKAYVDPSELSYQSFQNILQMDELFFGLKITNNQNIKLTVSPIHKVDNHFRFNIVDHDNLLMELHHMDLYSLPFNSLSRGGKRMIFSSLKLADILFDGLKASLQEKMILNSDQFSELYNNLNSVNHVFRLNSFGPGCKNFKSHYDTPFSDNQRKLYSKFTLIIYLTGGTNSENGCLRIDDQVIKQIPAFTGVIFDQRYEHEGWPYVQDEKVFIRTELIYFVKNIRQDERVAEIFNKACYFQKQAYYEHGNEEYANGLQKYSNDLFNHTTKLRYFLTEKTEELQAKREQKKRIILQEKGFDTVKSKYLLKKNCETTYVTDGNSFWFNDSIDLKLAAKLVLVDYFNGKMQFLSSNQINLYQRVKIHSEILNIKSVQEQKENSYINAESQIFEMLQQIAIQSQQNPYKYPFDFSQVVNTGDKEFNIMDYHCGICETITSLQYEQEARLQSLGRLKTKMDGIGVILFNGKLYVDDEMVRINKERGEVSFNGAFFDKAINFASCNCYTLKKWQFMAKQSIQVEGFALPKMRYNKFQSSKGYKLSIDMFKNGFIHRTKMNVSRPYAVEFDLHETIAPFYDQNQEYLNSDSDFDEVPGKRRADSEDQIEIGEALDCMSMKVNN